jgi:hypothetical protein
MRVTSRQDGSPWHASTAGVGRLLAHDNAIVQWTAIRIIGNLAGVDVDGKIPGILTRFLRPIREPVMITAANTIAAAGRIAAARPELARRIVFVILKVESARYQTDECRNIAIGHALTALAELGEPATHRRDVIEFVRRQTVNPRPATQNKARKLLARLERPAGARN